MSIVCLISNGSVVASFSFVFEKKNTNTDLTFQFKKVKESVLAFSVEGSGGTEI